MSLSDNLVAYWKLDEASGTRVDATGRGNDLTDNNTVTSNTGILSNAAEFVAANSEYLSRASNDDFQAVAGISISAWFYLHASFSGSGQVVAKDSDVVDGRGYALDIETDKLRFYTAGAGGGIAVDTTTLSKETWYHAVAIYNALSGSLTLNAGSPTASAMAVPGIGGGFRIGAREYSGFEGYFFGRIDEVGIWQRVLTSGEISELYNGGVGLNYPFSAPVSSPSFRINKIRPAFFKPGLAR